MGLAERIQSVRKERRLSQEAAAHAVGMSVRAYRSLEKGEAVDPHYSTLLGISRGLGVPITELLEETAPKDQASSEPGQLDRRGLGEFVLWLATQAPKGQPIEEQSDSAIAADREAREQIAGGARMGISAYFDEEEVSPEVEEAAALLLREYRRAKSGAPKA